MISKQKIVSLMDLTQLGDNDVDSDIINICNKANSSLGTVAAICVYKQFIPLVKKELDSDFKVATVVNFPLGQNSIENVVLETKQALDLGADEIDLVIDYKDYIANASSQYSCDLVSAVKEVCGSKDLKVIIESGELKSVELIKKASDDAIANGANFVKTSTGKTPNGASIEATKVILKSIKESKKAVGFKASGGIREYEQAVEYVELAIVEMTKSFVTPTTFRFGVSGLLDNLLSGDLSDGY